MHFERRTLKMHKIIFFSRIKKNYVCLPYIKFSNLLSKHTYFFIWPNILSKCKYCRCSCNSSNTKNMIIKASSQINLASLGSLAGWFESYLVANPKDKFSLVEAHFIVVTESQVREPKTKCLDIKPVIIPGFAQA